MDTGHHSGGGSAKSHILLERGGGEVVVDRVGAVKEPLEVVHANVECDGGADGRPERVPAADPVPEAEHILGVDPKLADPFGVGRERGKMLGHGGLVLGGGEQPGLGAVGVGHGLLGGEGLGRDEEERGLRVQA